MGWRTRATLASCGLLWAVGAACGGGGGGGGSIIFPVVFPQGFLPARLSTTDDTGDVAFEAGGDLYAVDGSADVTRISRVDGSRTAFSANVGGGAALRAIVHAGNKRFFVVDDTGMVYSIDSEGVSTPHANASVPITGLAIAPSGFGSVGGAVLAATTDGRILSITTSDMPAVSDFVGPGDVYVDLAISGSTVYALDASNGEIDTIDAMGAATSFQGGFANPVGFTVNGAQSELLVADAGDGALYAVPVAGGTPVALANYDFDPMPPSGLDYDGAGAVAWVARGSVVVHGTSVPRTDPANPNFGLVFASPNQGYGDLEFLQDGRFLLVANRTGSSPTNFLFLLPRDASFVDTLASGVGQSGEELLSLAHDAPANVTYIGSNLGNVYQRASDGGLTLLASISPDPLLGLELAPDTFGGFGGHLVATTSLGEVITVDPASPTPALLTTIDSLSPPTPALLIDLVFASDGRLFVLDRGDGPGGDEIDAQVIEVAPNGATEALVVEPTALGFPEGVAMDEGANRLLIATVKDSGPAQLIALSLGADGAGDESITAIANLVLQPGFFPTGIVYDRIGTAIVRQGAGTTAIDAFSVAP